MRYITLALLTASLAAPAAWAAPVLRTHAFAGGHAFMVGASDPTVGGPAVIFALSESQPVPAFDRGILNSVEASLRVDANATARVFAGGGTSPQTFLSDVVTNTSLLTAPDVFVSLPGALLSASCSVNPATPSCSASRPQPLSGDTTRTISSMELPSYLAGTSVNFSTGGRVDFRRIGTGTGSGTASGEVSGSYSYLFNYGYYDHSLASFLATDASSLDLDFGELLLGGPMVTLPFSIFNLGRAGSARLSLPMVLGSGPGFTTTLAPFAAEIDGGASMAHSASFTPSALGDFAQRITLPFIDQNLGLNRKGRTLTLNLRARVVDEPAPPVPAPAAVGLFALGVAGLALRRRA
jgi:hypothetical protein